MSIKNIRATPGTGRRQKLTKSVTKHAAGARSKAKYSVRVKHAVDCGKALVALRNLLRHGDWNTWLEEHCGINRMTANRYMRLASRAKELTPNMTIREAYITAGVIHAKRPRPRPSRSAS